MPGPTLVTKNVIGLELVVELDPAVLEEVAQADKNTLADT